MPVDTERFKNALSRFASGVTVLTVSVGDGDRRRGMTVSAFCSVSLEPPLVLACIHHESRCYALIEESGRFAVNLLTEDQKDLSNWFAGGGRDAADQFANLDWRPGQNGAPLLNDTLGFLECEVKEILPGGDHGIFLGLVTRAGTTDGVERPLLYYARDYRHMQFDGD